MNGDGKATSGRGRRLPKGARTAPDFATTDTLCDAAPVPGHWTGSVLFAFLAVGSLASAVRHFQRRRWFPVTREASAALGFACLAAGNQGYLPAGYGYGAGAFLTVSIAADLLIRRARRRERAA